MYLLKSDFSGQSDRRPGLQSTPPQSAGTTVRVTVLSAAVSTVLFATEFDARPGLFLGNIIYSANPFAYSLQRTSSLNHYVSLII